MYAVKQVIMHFLKSAQNGLLIAECAHWPLGSINRSGMPSISQRERKKRGTGGGDLGSGKIPPLFIPPPVIL